MVTIRIDTDLFRDFPTFRRGIVAGLGLSRGIDEAHITRQLRIIGLDIEAQELNISHDHLTPEWREVFALLGYSSLPYVSFLSKRSRASTSDGISITALMWRLIAAFVQAFGLPTGAFNLDNASPTLELGRVSGKAGLGNVPDNGQKIEKPNTDEVVFMNPTKGFLLCRKWNLEIMDQERDLFSGTGFLVTVDAIGPDSDSVILAAIELLTLGLQHICRDPIVAGTLTPDAAACQLTGPRLYQVDPGNLTLSFHKPAG